MNDAEMSIFPGNALVPDIWLKQLTPLQLSFIGDSVFELYVRTEILSKTRSSADRLDKLKKSIVNAAAQAQLAERMLPLLTEEEREIYRRGKNAKQHTTAKHQTVSDYHKASGLEALCGYLYLKGEGARLTELLRECMEL